MVVQYLPPGVWRSDPVHSRVGFAVPHCGLSYIHGTFKELVSEVTIDDDQRWVRWAIEIAVHSVDTNNEDRDNSIRSMDFIDVESHPAVRFVSTDVVPNEGGYTVSGPLAINGITHLAQLQARLSGPILTAAGVQRMGVYARGGVSRAAFGLRPPRDPHTAALADADVVYVDIEIEAVSRDADRGQDRRW